MSAMDAVPVNYGALPVQQVNSSAVAATAVAGARDDKDPHGRADVMTEAIQERDPTKLLSKDFMLEMAEGGLPFMGAFGNVAGAAIGFMVADNRAQKQTLAIIDQYREEIAEQLHIRPEVVDVRALLIAAQHNEALRQSISHIEGEREAHPFANISGLLGMVGAGVLFMPVLAFMGPLGWLGGMVAAGGGYMAGQYAGEKLFAPDQQLNPLVQMDELREKIANGQPLEAIDVFGLRVSQNPALRERIHNQFGHEYYKLSGQDKHYAMNMVRGGHELCARDAALVNAGGNMDDLMFGPMRELIANAPQLAPAEGGMEAPVTNEQQTAQPPQNAWVQRVGGESRLDAKRLGSFAERELSRRSAAAAAPAPLLP